MFGAHLLNVTPEELQGRNRSMNAYLQKMHKKSKKYNPIKKVKIEKTRETYSFYTAFQ